MGDSFIFQIQADETLVSLRETDPISEDELQQLVARYPDLLAGEQMNPRAPRRWLFISREYSIPDHEDGIGRWAIDHLFVDQDGIPTLVEVKLSKNTQIRREIVGQLFEYAANAVRHWPPSEMSEKFKIRVYLEIEQLEQQIARARTLTERHGAKLIRLEAEKLRAETALSDFLQGRDEETFWSQVDTNLKAGRVRLVFLANKIPLELRTIVEFLSLQLKPAEAFAVEVAQYNGLSANADPHAKPIRNLVSRLVAGQIPELIESTRVRWNTDLFFDKLASNSPTDIPIAHRLVEFGERLTGRPMSPGSGTATGALFAKLMVKGSLLSLFGIYTTGDLTINVGWHPVMGADTSKRWREEAARAGFAVDPSKWDSMHYPNHLRLEVADQNFEGFERFMESVRRELKDWEKTSDSMSQDIGIHDDDSGIAGA